MCRFALIWRLALVALLGWTCLDAAPPAAAAGKPAVVTDVRVGLHGRATRVVLDFSKSIKYSVFTLADPYRVVIDLPEVGWRLPARPLPSRRGVFEKLRYGLFKRGNSRVVVDTTGPIAIDKDFLMVPAAGRGHRLVLDLVPTSRAKMLKMARRAVQPAASPSMAAHRSPFPLPPRKPLRLRIKRTIAIDPGHGGIDPGATGISGIFEKNITLDVARILKRQLQQTGRYRVVMTRDRDVFVRLRERVALGREAGAELFVSLHADAIKNRKIRGLSVYTLSEKGSDREAEELADRENKADLIAGVDLSDKDEQLQGILIDLAQRDTKNDSVRFAMALVKELRRDTKLLRNSHRFAGFAVLKAPDVPSILVELGFLSNPSEEKALRQKKYRAKMAAAVVRAVDAHFRRIEQAERN
jgi:N-acetylmuramoyl-L-alanine amidase